MVSALEIPGGRGHHRAEAGRELPVGCGAQGCRPRSAIQGSAEGFVSVLTAALRRSALVLAPPQQRLPAFRGLAGRDLPGGGPLSGPECFENIKIGCLP